MTTLQPVLITNTEPANGPTSLLTEQDEHEVRCGICAREVCVGEEIYRLGSQAMDSGLDNPFRCEVCADEFDDFHLRT